jgi:hypothetical protein
MAKPHPKKPRRVSDEEVHQTILQLCRQAGLGGAVRPEAVAQHILPEHWQTLLKRVRLAGKQLAVAGRITILRKGEVTDPNDFKGLIRLQITELGLQPDPVEDPATGG